MTDDGQPWISIRAANIAGEPAFVNPPRYPINADNNISPPPVGRALQPQFVGIARQTLQTILANVLPQARISGMPGEQEIPAGLSAPLNAEERDYLQALLDAEAAAP